jgi:catechol 2,3-dioxygenase-like lactoylglutathione lyase family enzyme
MLDRFYLNPVLPAQDGDRARAFFRDVLGLKLLSGPTDDPTEMPECTPAGYAVISFR